MKQGHIRHGSLQFYPRKRAQKILPKVNWSYISEARKDVNLLGFIGYKVGMGSAYVKDNTPNSVMKGKRVTLPVTILECPSMKILSVRVYQNGKIIDETLNSNLDKELKKKIKIQKENKKSVEELLKKYDNKEVDIRILVYSQAKKTSIKKTPDIVELSLSGNNKQKIQLIQTLLPKEITLKDFLHEEINKTKLIDVRGVTKGKGFQGSAKRFGLDLQGHKTEKGVRGPGSGGPWHPARVEFTQPMAGQMGYFTRVINNIKVIFSGEIKEKDINPGEGFRHFGKIKTDYLIVEGSIQGPQKRQVLITVPLRPSKKQLKKNYDFIELR
ncbi:50S ribosomal protein L3 [Candidatus Pacearchaeota archaeon]|nr:50S ribosomal protein L3 [Candidatus Pacearchaeota archaeon]